MPDIGVNYGSLTDTTNTAGPVFFWDRGSTASTVSVDAAPTSVEWYNRWLSRDEIATLHRQTRMSYDIARRMYNDRDGLDEHWRCTIPAGSVRDPHYLNRWINPEELAARAIAQAEANAKNEWKTWASRAVWEVANMKEYFTTDDIWAFLDQIEVTTHDPRALGGIMRTVARKGWCQRDGRHVHTKRPVGHARPIPVYLSNLCDVESTT